MNLRSGRTLTAKNLRRDSRNYEEFNERKKYQEEQKKIEESIYDEEETEEEILEKKIKNIYHKTKHLLYLNQVQKSNNHSLIDKINTVSELYELFRYNMDYLIIYFNNKENKKFPEVIFKKGNDLCNEMAINVRTRKEKMLYKKCKEEIEFVRYLINFYILKK
jgi:hypothetical protein